MSNIIMHSQPYPLTPYPLSVTFNVFPQMTISPKVSVIESQSKSLYFLGPQVLTETVRVDLICKFYRFRSITQLQSLVIQHLQYLPVHLKDCLTTLLIARMW